MNDKNTILQDLRGALGNIGNKDGVKFEVSLDQKNNDAFYNFMLNVSCNCSRVE
jgi:hypothetical protein